MKLTLAYVSSKIKELKVKIVEIRAGPDHLHIFVADCKNIAPCKLIQQLKGFSSRMMRKNHWDLFRSYLWGDKFWSEGYFCRSVGAVNKETMKHYIEECQDKHWEKIEKPKIAKDFQNNLF